MKQFNISLFLSSVVLGLSFITGCILIQNDLNFKEPIVTNEITNESKVLMNTKETAEYLNLTEQQVITIIESENYILNLAHSYDGKMFPYIKIDNEIFVSRDELNEWIKESTLQRKKYTKEL
ncbi:helix-turn-helix domain-containing protein [Paenibacillus sp. sgz500958]|uniref:helix-turn-helix domain-containing protein n=1 Tax=Paenibacillus sp. sgz500958 TaxID=3242475 RepID=UPI0036D3A0E3